MRWIDWTHAVCLKDVVGLFVLFIWLQKSDSSFLLGLMNKVILLFKISKLSFHKHLQYFSVILPFILGTKIDLFFLIVLKETISNLL